MNISINLSNRLISEALHDFLKKFGDGYQISVADESNPGNNIRPDVVLVDSNNINRKLFSQYPESKVILIDTGMKQEDIIAIMLSYKIHGVFSANTNIRLLKKALEVICDGQVWIDNSILKIFLHNARFISKKGGVDGVTEREKEIIGHVCRGYTNKEIASKLSLSEQTVKAHLNRIFRKFNVSSRSQLVAIAMGNQMNQCYFEIKA
jgi:DNA-binding NarL/FixJ family response regulator